MLNIDPNNMTEYVKKILYCLFSQNENTVFSIDAEYTLVVDNISPHLQNKLIAICLTHTLIKRPCNIPGKHAGEYRYEVLSNNKPLGKGDYGAVRKIKGSLVPSHLMNTVFFKKKSAEHKRIVKIEDQIPGTKLFRHKIDDEYTLSSPELHVKEPVFIQNKNNPSLLTSYLLMRRLLGQNLAAVLYEHTIPLSTNPCLTLSLALLESVKIQLQDRRIVHRDLKPANIMVNYKEELSEWQVTIIDYGFSKRVRANDKNSKAGNYLYMSPEGYYKKGTNLKSDIYSIGCIISEILGCNRETIKKHVQLQHEHQNIIDLENIFVNTPELNQFCKILLKRLILNMTKKDFNLRHSIDEAISKLKDIIVLHHKLTPDKKNIAAPSGYSLFNNQTKKNTSPVRAPLSTLSNIHEPVLKK